MKFKLFSISDSIASTQLPFTVEDMANASYHNQRPVLSTEYAECQSMQLYVWFLFIVLYQINLSLLNVPRFDSNSHI